MMADKIIIAIERFVGAANCVGYGTTIANPAFIGKNGLKVRLFVSTR